MIDRTLESAAAAYAQARSLTLAERLGHGMHGIVFVAENNTFPGKFAVKIHRQPEPYYREREIYERLREQRVSQISGCNVPRLLHAEDTHLAVEMTIVSRPFVLDFGGAYLDEPPDFPPNVWDEWRADKAEQFGEDWNRVELILTELRLMGIHLLDVHSGNIALH